MLDGIRALIAFERTGTVSEAAAQLRLTQSAVSKRIQALEAELSYKLVETDGRKLKLTAKALQFLSKAKPLLLEIENLKFIESVAQNGEFAIGISDSIASSWGPALLKQALSLNKNVQLDLHVHRATLILEKLRLGHYEIGLIAGRPAGQDLIWTRIADESMVIAGKRNEDRKILTIEPVSSTWKEIGHTCLHHPQLKKHEFVFVESFFAAAQLAKQGFGQALIPIGIAKIAGFKKSESIQLSPKVMRQISFVSRKSVDRIPAVVHLLTSIEAIAPALIG